MTTDEERPRVLDSHMTLEDARALVEELTERATSTIHLQEATVQRILGVYGTPIKDSVITSAPEHTMGRLMNALQSLRDVIAENNRLAEELSRL